MYLAHHQALTEPLYVTGLSSNGKMLIGGVFRMHDSVGFPLDCCFEESKLRGFDIDWLEALCDCWLNDCAKYDSFCRQASNCARIDLDELFKRSGAMVANMFPKMLKCPNPVDVVCKYIIRRKKLGKS
jgi:hypothetical protein